MTERYVDPSDTILLEVFHYELLDGLAFHGLYILRGMHVFDLREVSGTLLHCMGLFWRELMLMGRTALVVERFICLIEVFLDRFDKLVHLHAH